MQKVIDLRLDFPLTAEEIAERIKFFTLNKDGKGIANYRHIFGPRWASSLGMTFEKLEKKSEELPAEEYDTFLKHLAQKIALTPTEFIQQLDAACVEWGLVETPDNHKTEKLISQIPDRLKGMAIVDPFQGNKAIKDLEEAIKELGFIAAYASPYRWGIPADDPRFYPIYAKAVELDIPVFIYTSMNYRTDLPMDIARPLNLDRVCMAFPELRIVASCGGWPWVPEMIGVARRHQNVYIDTSSHRPKYLATPGSGWEMLIQFGSTLLQDRIIFASGAADLGLPISQIVMEMRALPIKEEIKEKWLYQNAQNLFRLS